MSVLVLAMAVMSESGGGDESPMLTDALGWLPTDTETLTVARSFKVELPDRSSGLADLFRQGCFLGLDRSVPLDAMQGRGVAFAVWGERSFDVVSAFGGLRSESCTILFFDEELGDAWKKLEVLLESKAQKVREIAQHKVFQLPSTIVKEPTYQLKEWEGLFVTQVEPHILLVASSDRFLKEVLTRRGVEQAQRALPPSLPEWKLVDRSAPLWMIRHTRKAPPQAFFDGLTASWKSAEFRAVYVGARARAENAVRHVWDHSAFMRLALPNFELPAEIREMKVTPASVSSENGTVVVTLDLKSLVPREVGEAKPTPGQFVSQFWYTMLMQRMRGEDGTLFGGPRFIPLELRR